MDSLKASMREKMIQQLKASGGEPTISQRMKEKWANLEFKIGMSLVIDFLKKNDLAYSMSVLIPESGLGEGYLSKIELQELLAMGDGGRPHEPLLGEVVDSMRRGHALWPNLKDMAVQAEGGTESFTVDQKLKLIDNKFQERMAAERLVPFKTMEERMLKYKRECDERVWREVEAEIEWVR